MNVTTTDAAKTLAKAFIEGRERTIRECFAKDRALFWHGTMIAQLVSRTILRICFVGNGSYDVKADWFNGILDAAGAKYHFEQRRLWDEEANKAELLSSTLWYVLTLPPSTPLTGPVAGTEEPTTDTPPPPVIVTQGRDELGRAVEILRRPPPVEDIEAMLDDLRDTPF